MKNRKEQRMISEKETHEEREYKKQRLEQTENTNALEKNQFKKD